MAWMRDLVSDYLAQARDLLERIEPMALRDFTEVLYRAWRDGARVYTFGNGGSASTAQHLAADLFCATQVGERRGLRVLCLNDNMPLVSALTNDCGFEQVFVRQLRTWWEAGDVALGISVHGGAGEAEAGPWSRNVLAALRHANEHGGSSLGLMGFDGGAMRSLCTASVTVPVESTPHTEGLHAVLHHLIATALRRRIERDREGASA
jgi:D-sedoheptulose 7-phosphate isomerase